MKFFLFILLVAVVVKLPAQSISLAGEWRFRIDRNDVGIQEEWFKQALDDKIKLPGSMLTNGKGDAVTIKTKWTGSIYDSSWYFNPRMAAYRQPDNLKFPFWLTPDKHYVGAAWYQKEIEVPVNWKDRHIELFLERCHTETMVWIDDQLIGMQNSFAVPHVYDLTALSKPGKHTITIRIDNRIKAINVGPDSHSLTDHTQGNWNGIVGKLELQAMPVTYIEDVQVYPDVVNKRARILVKVNGIQGSNVSKLTVTATVINTTIKHEVPAAQAAADTLTEVNLPMTNKVQLWDEFNPALYKLRVQLDNGNTKEVVFGMRELKIEGNQFLLNGKPIFLRGTVNNCEFPLTGFAPMDEAGWARVYKIAKAHGLNHLRFHSYCPPEAAFIAADKAGFYLQPEFPGWVNHGTSMGDKKPVDTFIYAETNRMAQWYGNHASFVLEAVGGNEPTGRGYVKFLAGLIQYWQAKDKRRVYTGASVGNSWALVPENEFMVKAGARGLNWPATRPESDSDYHATIEKFPVPYITHEMGQWCVFPDFKEINRYTGVNKAKNFELFQEELAKHGMGNKGRAFLMASGKLQALCYKHEIEKALRTKGLAGFQLLGLQDFPGQGTALVGMVNALWENKPYITAAAINRYCNSVVPLMRTHKFVYTNEETFTAAVELYNYGKGPLKDALINWTIKDSIGKLLTKGSFPAKDYAIGNCISIGEITYKLAAIKSPMRLNVEISIANTSFINDWDFYVFPSSVPDIGTNSTVHICDSLDGIAIDRLKAGGSVLVLGGKKVVKGKEIVNHFTPVFWNTSWFKMRPPHTLGLLCDPTHPAFAAFPTSYHSDLQWWEIVNKAPVMHLEDFPKEFQPLLQPIDTWFINRKLAFLFETKVGKGKLMICSLDLQTNLGGRPAARQLLYSLLKYMQSKTFNPSQEVPLGTIQALFTTPSVEAWNGYTKDAPDELKTKLNN